MENQPVPQFQTPQDATKFDPDYLKQIASKPKSKSGLFSAKMFILLGGLLVTIIAAFVLMIISNNNAASPKVDSETLFLRTTNLQKTAKSYHKYIKSSSLRAINSSYQVQLADTLRELNANLVNMNIKTNKIKKELVEEEQSRVVDIDNALNDARLNVRLDRNYAQEMAYQTKLVLALIQKLEHSTRAKDYKAMLETSRTNLEPIASQFSEFIAD